MVMVMRERGWERVTSNGFDIAVGGRVGSDGVGGCF